MLPTERGRALDYAVAREVMADSANTLRQYGAHRYSSSREYAGCVEEEIERRGLVVQYMEALTDLVEGDATEPPNTPLYDWCMKQNFQLLRATPEQRCIAALQAVRESKGVDHAD